MNINTMNMKKYIAALFGAIALVASGCADYDKDIENLNKRIDEIENNRIKSIDQQIENINASLPKLEQADKNLKDMITDLEGTAVDLRKSISDNEKSIAAVKSDLESAVKELQASDKKNKEELIDAISAAKGEVLANLEAAKTEVGGKLNAINGTISDLKAKDAELEKKISDLKEYVDKELKGTKDWANASFATLTQYNGIVEQIAGINSGISGLNTSLKNLEERLTKKFTEDLGKSLTELNGKIADEVAGLNERIGKEVADITAAYTAAIAKASEELEKAWAEKLKTSIDDLEKSLKAWVNEKLTAYWTIEETRAALEAQRKDLETQLEAQKALIKGLIDANTGDITKLKEALAETENAIEANSKEIADLSSALGVAKEEITNAYKKAIEDAIAGLNADLDKAIKEANDKIDKTAAELRTRIDKCDKDVRDAIDKINKALSEIQNKIQSVTYRPEYSDGVHNVYRDTKTFRMMFEIRPASVVSKLNTSNVKMQAYVDWGRGQWKTFDLTVIGIVSESNGVIAVKASAETIKNSSATFFDSSWSYITYAKLLIEDSTLGWEISSDFIRLKVVSGSLEPDKLYGHEYVEMGDGLKWATCNIGADKPKDVGSLFAWGETTPKSTYTLENYKWYENGNYTKYNSTDGKLFLNKDDDAATANWGGTWRTPTFNELLKLVEHCKCTWDDTRNGYIVTSEFPGYEGNSIFLPSPTYNPTIYNGLYWTSQGKIKDITIAGTFAIKKSNDDRIGLSSFPRYLGLPIRPVSF